MGTFATLAPALIAAGTSAAGGALSASQANARARNQMQANQAAYRAQRQQIELQHRKAERERREALRHATAERRARLGSQAGGTSSGSGAAVIGGLTAKSARAGEDEGNLREQSLRGSLIDLQNRNKTALLRASQARQSALFDTAKSLGQIAASKLNE